MKKLVSLFLMLVFVFIQLPLAITLHAEPVSPDPGLIIENFPEYSRAEIEDLPSVSDFHYDFPKPGPDWQKLTAGDQPASFSLVEYKLADDVLDITGYDSVISEIASEGQLLAGSKIQKQKPLDIVAAGGYIPRSVLDTAAMQQGRVVEEGMVVVDTASKTAFKVVTPTIHTGMYLADSELQKLVSPLQNTYSINKPQLHEIFAEFSLGGTEGETIELTRGNISGFAPNIERNMVLPEAGAIEYLGLKEKYQGFNNVFGDLLVNLQFDDELLEGQLSNGSKVKVKVSGGIGIQKILVNAKYTRFSGYRFAMTLNQESYLVVEMDASLKEEIRIPVFGINADIGDVGRISGGVFVIVGLNGEFRLEIGAREFTSTTVGVRGGTKFYVPTSIKPYHSQTLKGDGDVNLTGDADGYIKFGPMLGVEIFGFDLVGAGVFLGTGVQVEADMYHLNIELYGILNVYADFLGKHFNLINLRPTFWERKQMDTAGHLITFMEAYVYPGRVSGIISRESPPGTGSGDGFVPVPNLPYRIWIVPKDISFNPSDPKDLNNPDISKYPASGYARTDSKGIFFQKDDNILSGGEKAYVEFQVNGKTYFSNPAEATLPFENYTITQADYFNDYVVGQVQPIRVINWNVPESDPDNRYDLIYYANSPIQVRHYFYSKTPYYDFCLSTGGVAYARTDEYGNFDTRNLFVSDDGEEMPHWKFDIRADAEKWIHFDSFRFKLILDHRGATISGEVPYSATMNMNFSRYVEEVPDSHKRFEAFGRIIDQMAYDEYIYIINPGGSLAVAEKEFCYWAEVFSTQDFHAGLIDYRYVPDDEREMMWLKGAPDANNPAKKLLPVLDAEGNPTGSALFLQRVYVEWVWQAHPNPVTITSADNYVAETDGGLFQVTASGYAPFAFSLSDAPPEITIDRDSGVISIAEGIPADVYQFTIHATENREKYQMTLPDGTVVDQSRLLGPYEGNDPSPPAQQLFTLEVREAIIQPEPSPEPTVSPAPTQSPTPTVTPPARTAPVIREEQHDYNFTMPAGSDGLQIQVRAAGSTPISWSLAPAGRQPFPDGASIDPDTGLLTISPGLDWGVYQFTVRAQNDIGSDERICILDVRIAPVILDELHEYKFVKSSNKEDTVIPIVATGSLPITWSLEQTGRYPLSEDIFIDEQTGVLTIAADIARGDYYFTIRATNDIGSDTQDCTLKVMYIPFQLHNFSEPGNISENTDYLTLSSQPGQFFSELPWQGSIFFDSDDQFAVDPSELKLNPPNILTLRYDDPEDVYTNDRWEKNGALFVRWQSFPGVLQRWNHFNDVFWSAGTGTILLDSSPRSDNYHYRQQNTPSDPVDDMKQLYQAKITAYNQAKPFTEQAFDYRLTTSGFNTNISQKGSLANFLDYGTVIDKMKNSQGGSHQVILDKDSGTLVTGKFFTALQEDDDASISFFLDGAAIAFKGRDIDQALGHETYDFAYIPGSFYESAILSSLDADERHFLCSFVGGDELPGLASFNITTDFEQGAKLNVYQYDAAADQFILIAGEVTVKDEGSVVFRNQILSEYLVTTQEIKGALVSDMAALQTIDEEDSKWQVYAGISILILAVAVSIILAMHEKKRRNSSKPAK